VDETGSGSWPVVGSVEHSGSATTVFEKKQPNELDIRRSKVSDVDGRHTLGTISSPPRRVHPAALTTHLHLMPRLRMR
jgi:hypothetical protein